MSKEEALNLDIVNHGGLTKRVEFCGFLGRGGWFQIRYPGGAGLWAFSLRHGRMEAKHSEHSNWRVADPEVLARIREMARDANVKFTVETPRATKKNKPARPATSVEQRQSAWCK